MVAGLPLALSPPLLIRSRPNHVLVVGLGHSVVLMYTMSIWIAYVGLGMGAAFPTLVRALLIRSRPDNVHVVGLCHPVILMYNLSK